jgi:hypothetical protein
MLNFIATPGSLRKLATRTSLFAVAAAASAIYLAPQSLLAQSAPSTASADSAKYLDDVKSLSSPEMEGRGDGTKGLTLAEHLIVERYKSLGLEPAGSKSYLQSFRVVTGRKIQGGTKMSGHANGGKVESYAVRDDYTPLNFSATGNAKASVVFAGYGITAPEFGYDDFHDADVRDKVVLVLRGEPEALAQKASAGGHTRHASLITKAINAKTASFLMENRTNCFRSATPKARKKQAFSVCRSKRPSPMNGSGPPASLPQSCRTPSKKKKALASPFPSILLSMSR